MRECNLFYQHHTFVIRLNNLFEKHVASSQGFFTADMDGFKLLETIGLELDLPVISRLFDTQYMLYERNMTAYHD